MNSPIFQRTTHPDLQRISVETVRRIVFLSFSLDDFKFFFYFQLSTLLDERTEDLIIIDARYPFEYLGGHIQSAQNIYTEEQLRIFFNDLISSTNLVSSSTIFIFHCEFSSERAPRLCRLFRSIDRQRNLSNYPSLSFPFVYLLDGGYSEFFQSTKRKRWCEPENYISMFAQQHLDELHRHRQAKKVATGRMKIEFFTSIPFQL